MNYLLLDLEEMYKERGYDIEKRSEDVEGLEIIQPVFYVLDEKSKYQKFYYDLISDKIRFFRPKYTHSHVNVNLSVNLRDFQKFTRHLDLKIYTIDDGRHFDNRVKMSHEEVIDQIPKTLFE